MVVWGRKKENDTYLRAGVWSGLFLKRCVLEPNPRCVFGLLGLRTGLEEYNMTKEEDASRHENVAHSACTEAETRASVPGAAACAANRHRT